MNKKTKPKPQLPLKNTNNLREKFYTENQKEYYFPLLYKTWTH